MLCHVILNRDKKTGCAQAIGRKEMRTTETEMGGCVKRDLAGLGGKGRKRARDGEEETGDGDRTNDGRNRKTNIEELYRYQPQPALSGKNNSVCNI